MDVTWIFELLIICIVFFSKKYWIPLLKGSVILRVARTLVSAANELHITGEIEDKAQWVWDAMVEFLSKYKITFDEKEVKAYIKRAVTELRVDIKNTSAEKVEQG
jgi:uncharacterized protein YxjI